MAPTLHDYQHTAARWLQERPRSALFLDMGLGKSASSLTALTPEHLPVVVIAPKRVAETVWGPETALWRPDLSFALAAGTREQRLKALTSGADVIALGRDNIRDLVGRKADLRINTLVLDELSGFKAASSVRWKTARKLVKEYSIKHVWGLTGTPAPNGLLDLWAQIALLDEGARLGKTMTAYRSRYFIPGRQLANGVITEWLPREGTPAKIHRLLEDICISMDGEGRLDLPPVTYNTLEIVLPPAAVRAYRDLKRDLLAQLDDVGLPVVASNAAVMTGKLSQVTAGFLYEGDPATGPSSVYHTLHDEKIKAVREVVDGTGSPVLVFHRFRAERERLMRAFPEARDVTEAGAIEDWNAGRVPVLLAHPASAGHGLNLQHGGHTIVWTTLPWSLEEWEQGNGRLARQGQKFPVVVHTVAAHGTLDYVIADRLAGKADVQNALRSHLEAAL